MIKRFGNYLLTHHWQAGLLAMLFGFTPLLGFMSTLILGLITLAQGPQKGLWILWWASIPDITFALIGHPEILIFGVLGGGVYVWLIASAFRYAASWGLVLELSVLLGAITVIIVHVINPEINTFWITKYQSSVTHMTEGLANAGPELDTANLNMADILNNPALLKRIATITTGILAALLMVGNIINLALSRWWQALIINAHEFRSELRNIRLGYITSIGFVLCAIFAFSGYDVALDMLPVFFALFFMAGLSLIHYGAGKTKKGLYGLVAFYISLAVFLEVVFCLVVFVALLDSAFNIRQHWKAISDSR